MPVVGSDRSTYCTVADLIAFGVPSDKASDSVCEVASRIVDDYTGTTFSGASTKTFIARDVRNSSVVLPGPFSDITAVEINGVAIASTSYAVTDTGVSFAGPYNAGYGLGLGMSSNGGMGAIHDVDGFPVGGAMRRGLRTPYGATVKITGTFGWTTIPAKVKLATKILASSIAVRTASDLIDPRIALISVEGYQVRYKEVPNIDTTGSAEADRLLADFRSGGSFVR